MSENSLASGNPFQDSSHRRTTRNAGRRPPRLLLPALFFQLHATPSTAVRRPSHELILTAILEWYLFHNPEKADVNLIQSLLDRFLRPYSTDLKQGPRSRTTHSGGDLIDQGQTGVTNDDDEEEEEEEKESRDGEEMEEEEEEESGYTEALSALLESMLRKYAGQRPVCTNRNLTVMAAIASLYMRYIRPLEIVYEFGRFYSVDPLTPADFISRPLVLVLGPYSSGKSQFIQTLAGRRVPGLRVADEPATKHFHICMSGTASSSLSSSLSPSSSGSGSRNPFGDGETEDSGMDREDEVLPGYAVTSLPELPFQALASRFGSAVLDRLRCTRMYGRCGLLQRITLIDTPGIMSSVSGSFTAASSRSGQSRRTGAQLEEEDDRRSTVEWMHSDREALQAVSINSERPYDYPAVVQWFAERSERILLFFDVLKLDISDEFKTCVALLSGRSDGPDSGTGLPGSGIDNSTKIRCVLNRADLLFPEETGEGEEETEEARRVSIALFVLYCCSFSFFIFVSFLSIIIILPFCLSFSFFFFPSVLSLSPSCVVVVRRHS